MRSDLPFKARALKVAQPPGDREAHTSMLLNAIKILPTPLWGRTASLKLPKSDEVGCAIAGLPTEGILTEQQAFFERRTLHPRPKDRGFSRNSVNSCVWTLCNE